MGDIEFIKSKIKIIPDFPQKGIMFQASAFLANCAKLQDIFPVFQDPLAVEALITHIVGHIIEKFGNSVDVIVGLDARGFLLGPVIALRLGAAFVPVRKRGKLPGETTEVAYVKEYGTDYFEMQKGACKEGQKVIVIDDLIATGYNFAKFHNLSRGSAKAAGDLIKGNNARVLEYIFFVELCALGGSAKLDAPTYSLIKDQS
ncbi:MAG: hypothetical protein SGCHY_001147 [Lobulomycetales sp.]